MERAYFPSLLLACLLASCCCSPTSPRQHGERNSRAESGSSRGIAGSDVPHQQARPSNLNPLPLTQYEQEGYASCWATCGEMIMQWVGGIRVRQCKQAAQKFTRSDCCDAQGKLITGLLCDNGGDPDFQAWGFDCAPTIAVPLVWGEATKEIDDSRPFAFSRRKVVNNIISGVHMMVVAGYATDGVEQSLFVLSPYFEHPPDAMLVPFDDYRGNAAGGSSYYLNVSNYYGIVVH